MKNIKVGTIIKVQEKHKWGGCIMTVSEIKSFGVVAEMNIPGGAETSIRLNWEDFLPIDQPKDELLKEAAQTLDGIYIAKHTDTLTDGDFNECVEMSEKIKNFYK